MSKIPVILLAAGGSSRLGMPKQLLSWGNKTLLQHQIEKLHKLSSSLIVVLGAYADEIIQTIPAEKVNIVVNEHWQKGMGSSISCGISHLEATYPAASAVLIALADQPLIPDSHYNKMMEMYISGKQQIIASRASKGWLGVPALFDKWYFKSLKELDGEMGAREIIMYYKNNVLSIGCSEMSMDIDTHTDYLKVLYSTNLNN